MNAEASKQLAANGGKPVRTDPWPKRRLFGEEEKRAAVELFDKCIEAGDAFGYNGAEEDGYCREFSDYLGGGYADAVNSGTSAVYVALHALDLEPFSEVIVPPVSDPGGVMPVPMIGCIPIPADAVPGSYNLGAEQIEHRITERTSAIVVAHITGLPCEMDAIMALAAKHNLPVVEDCAQSHGATFRKRMTGTFGTVAAFSTMSGKHHATGAQGGVVFTQDEQLYWKIRRSSDRGKPFGLEGAAGNVVCSHNLNANELACAIGRAQLKKLPWIVKSRRKAAGAIAAGCEQLQAVRLNTGPSDGEGVYWFLIFRLELDRLSVDKQTFVEALGAEGIPAGASYWHSPTQQPWAVERKVLGAPGWPWTSPSYKGDPDAEYPVPNAKAADDAHFTLGFHERVGQQEVDDIVAALKKVEAVFVK